MSEFNSQPGSDPEMNLSSDQTPQANPQQSADPMKQTPYPQNGNPNQQPYGQTAWQPYQPSQQPYGAYQQGGMYQQPYGQNPQQGGYAGPYQDQTQGGYYVPYAAGVPAAEQPAAEQDNKKIKRMRRSSFWGGLLTGVMLMMVVVCGYFAVQLFVHPGTANISYDQLGTEAVLSSEQQQEVLGKIDKLVRYITTYYVEDVDVDVLLDGAYHGVVDALEDKYADYMNEAEYADYNMDSTGDYVGIGVTVTVHDGDVKGLEVINVSQEGAAYEAGIEVGDIIIGADDMTFDGDMLLTEMVSYVRGKEGTYVDITYVRDGQTYTVTMERRKLHETNVYYTVMDGGVGYLALTGFTANAQGQFDAALSDLQSQGITSLIIDLRDNGGGLVSVCVDIADHIVGKGVVTYLEMKDGYQEKYYATSDEELNIPIVVLVNGNSASASELLTLCLMDYGKVTVVGTQTYGKGIAQSIYPLNDGTAIKFTVAKYYSPNGTNIHGTGITPDVVVELPEDVKFSTIKTNGIPDVTKDTQLQEALRILTEGQ